MDEATLGDLIRDYSTPLLGYVSKLTWGDRQLAEDIVQETFLRVWQRPNVLTTGHASIGPWLFTVARNLVNDHRRVRANKPIEINVADLAPLPEKRDLLDEILLAQDMRRAMAQLSQQHRAILTQVYYHDQSFEDVAKSLQIPIGTVKSRTYYALRSLRTVLMRLGYPPMNGSSGTGPRPGSESEQHQDRALLPSVTSSNCPRSFAGEPCVPRSVRRSPRRSAVAARPRSPRLIPQHALRA
jgi:RNA polymerase sigma-70 factor (ECF subfamily)